MIEWDKMLHIVNNMQQKFVYYQYKSFHIEDSADYFNEWFDNNKLSSSSWDWEILKSSKKERICHICNKGQETFKFHIILEAHCQKNINKKQILFLRQTKNEMW